MKPAAMLFLIAAAGFGQPATASVQGTVVDAVTQKPIRVAAVTALRTGLPAFYKRVHVGADGSFLIQSLLAGNYSMCVQAQEAGYVDPCLWTMQPATVSVIAGGSRSGVVLRLAAASTLTVQVQDAQQLLKQPTKDGRPPELSLGVYGPKGLYYPAIKTNNPPPDGIQLSGKPVYVYRLSIPRDMTLQLSVVSRDLKLGDDQGRDLPANASQQAFQHATGDPSPKSFTFSVVGKKP